MTQIQRLWAPWRQKYVKQLNDQKNGCVFCGIRASKKDKENLIFIRRQNAFSVLNRYPYSNGHCLVVSNRHIGDINKLSVTEYREMTNLVLETKSLLEAALKPKGFNIGMNLGSVAGAGIPGHVHFHVVPRWKGDHNFMSVTAGTKVISQSLTAIYQVLSHAHKKRH
jgi:ATP adenylyltransferase